ncbi:hypothetical protein AB7318_04435 [Providencia rettgeri]|uniref:hypothetical protein n=1 Tax=Providencia sp. M-8 TaxID=2713151 RepID=UPI00140CDC3C|nr:hypothetical protein [Providencia sp. M-8]
MRIKNSSTILNYHSEPQRKISPIEFNNILNDIKNHCINSPKELKARSITISIPKSYSDDFEMLAIKAYRQEERRIYREECSAAFKFKTHNGMKRGIFSLAQQLANKSGENILAMDPQPHAALPKRKLFRPQPPFIAFISALGYTLFS